MAASLREDGQIPMMLIHGAWLSARSWENYLDSRTTLPHPRRRLVQEACWDRSAWCW